MKNVFRSIILLEVNVNKVEGDASMTVMEIVSAKKVSGKRTLVSVK